MSHELREGLHWLSVDYVPVVGMDWTDPQDGGMWTKSCLSFFLLLFGFFKGNNANSLNLR
jgi:hypothetical protein